MKTTYLRYLLPIITCTLPYLGIWAEKLRQLTLHDGLAGVTVTAVKEDPSGKIWVATSNGVSLFNGVSLKNYPLPRLTEGMANYCFDIDIDSAGNLWTATKGGVYVLRRYADGFESAGNLKHAECVACSGDTVYIGTRTGLSMIVRNGRPYSVNITDGEMMENSSVRCLRIWNGSVWMTMRNGLFQLDRATGKSIWHKMELPSGLSRFDICAGKLFVGTKNNGLYVFTPDDGKYRRMNNVGNVITDVHAYGDTAVCVSVNGEGGYIIDAHNETVTKHFSTGNRPALPDNALSTFIRTREGINCFGMQQNGMAYDYKTYRFFYPYSLGAFTTQGMKVKTAYADGNIRFIATVDGFWMTDTNNGISRHFDTGTMGGHTITDFCRHGSYYYIATYDGGLIRLDKKDMTLSRLRDCPKLTYATVHSLTTDHSNRLWAATSEGLFVISDNDMIHNYTEKNSKIPEGVYSIWFDSHNNGWIGSAHGLCLYLSNENAFKTSGFPDGFFDKVNGLHVTGCGDTIYAWSDIKLFMTDSRMSNFREITLPEGVLSERLMDITADSEGNLWILTEEGVFLTDTHSSRTIHIGENFGIGSPTMATGTLGQDNIYMWVGTNDGLMMAEKKLLYDNIMSKYKPKIELDYVMTGEHTIGYGDMMRVNDSQRLTLTWNMIAPRLLAMPVLLDYSRQSREFYEYRLDDNEWNISPLGQAITMNHLMPGRHTLQIRMAGIANGTVTYTIDVYPSALFYLETVLLIAVVALLWWWNRWRRKTNILLQEHIDTEEALIEELTSPELPKTEEMGTEETKTEPNSDTTQTATKTDYNKYKKSRITDKELTQLFLRMDDYVKTNRPYLEKDLKMSDIATALGVSPSLLSQVFTLHLKEPYYDYINRYRLEEFKTFIREGKHKQFTIMALSEQCGFKKTSFFSTFRKVEGLTPTEYIQKNLQ